MSNNNNNQVPINRNNKFFSQRDFELEMVVYKTTNIINDKIYVGQDSKNNPNYLGSGKIMKRAIKKYGKDNFTKEILEICKTKKELDKLEKFWIHELNSTNNVIGYNITDGGEGCLGLRHSEETKKIMRLNNIGSNNPMYGKKLSKKSISRRSNKVKLEGTFKGKNNGNFKYVILETDLKRLFIEEDKTIGEIANIFKCSRDVINGNLRKFKINKPKSNKYNLDISVIRNLIADGLTQVQIGEIYGCSNKLINKYIKRHG